MDLSLQFRVKLDSKDTIHIHAQANVVSRSLQLLSKDSDTAVECINFGSCYYGTDILLSYCLYNAGPEEVNFVIVLDEGGEGQEVVRSSFI